MRAAIERYELLDGTTLDLSPLSRNDLAFLLDLQRRAFEDENHFSLQLALCGQHAYPLKGSLRVTRKIHDSLLYRVAEDIVDRVGLRQGYMCPDEGDRPVATDDIVSVAEAAKELGITQRAVIAAIRAGRLRGKKIGKTWALLRRSVAWYASAKRRSAGDGAETTVARAS